MASSSVEPQANKTYQISFDAYMKFRMNYSPSHLQVQEFIQSGKFNANLKINLLQTVVESGYWDEIHSDERVHDSPVYPHCEVEDKRPLVDHKLLSTQIVIEMSYDLYQKITDELQAKTALWQITPGPLYGVYKILTIERPYKVVKIKHGVYKRPNFDETFEMYKKMCFLMDSDNMAGSITEEFFAAYPAFLSNNYKYFYEDKKYNPKLVDIKPVSEMGDIIPLKKFKKDTYVPADICRVTITIHDVDLPANMSQLKEILTLFC